MRERIAGERILRATWTRSAGSVNDGCYLLTDPPRNQVSGVPIDRHLRWDHRDHAVRSATRPAQWLSEQDAEPSQLTIDSAVSPDFT